MFSVMMARKPATVKASDCQTGKRVPSDPGCRPGGLKVL